MNKTQLDRFKKRIVNELKNVCDYEGMKLKFNEAQDFYTDGKILVCRADVSPDILYGSVAAMIQRAHDMKKDKYYSFYPNLNGAFSELNHTAWDKHCFSAHGNEFLGMVECAIDQFNLIDGEPVVNIGAKYVKWIIDLFGEVEFMYANSHDPLLVEKDGWIVLLMPWRSSTKKELERYNRLWVK